MAGRRPLEERVGALERRLDADAETGDSTAAQAVPGESTETSPEALAARVDELEATIGELEAAIEALRGYVGSVEHVNERVERRANAALAAVERLDSAPETPPPIATATREVPADQAAEPADTDSEDSPEPDDGGLLDGLSPLE